jgi:hypothetical protein
VRAYLDLEVVTSMYYILISLDEYIVEMAKILFHQSSCVVSHCIV